MRCAHRFMILGRPSLFNNHPQPLRHGALAWLQVLETLTMMVPHQERVISSMEQPSNSQDNSGPMRTSTEPNSPEGSSQERVCRTTTWSLLGPCVLSPGQVKPWSSGDPTQFPLETRGFDPWTTCLEKTKAYDKGRIELWKDELEKILLFVRLAEVIRVGMGQL